MKDHGEIGHLTKYDAFRMNRDQVMNLEIQFKIPPYKLNVSNFYKLNVSNFYKASPKTI